MPYEEIERRYPLLIAAMKWAAILCTTEAADCIRAIQEHRGSGEAVQHFGGPVAVFQGAMRCRKWARENRKRAAFRSVNNTTMTGPDGCFPAFI